MAGPPVALDTATELACGVDDDLCNDVASLRAVLSESATSNSQGINPRGHVLITETTSIKLGLFNWCIVYTINHFTLHSGSVYNTYVEREGSREESTRDVVAELQVCLDKNMALQVNTCMIIKMFFLAT